MSRYSLILVTIDCLRADHVGFLGYDRPTTPFLDSLAQESFVFPAAIVGGLPTYYSFPAILASRHPLALGRDVVGLAPGEPNLALVLQSSGYATAAFSAANPYISKRFGYDQGFDRFEDFLEGPSDDPIRTEPRLRSRLNQAIERTASRVPPLRKIYNDLYFQYCQQSMPVPQSMETLRRFPAADVVVDHALAWIESVSLPYFGWLHLMDPHSPYYPKQEALSAVGNRVTPGRARYVNSYWNRGDVGERALARYRNEIVELYDAGIRWADMQIARLVDSLRRSGDWDNCILVVTADHGEEFLDHGGRYHPPSRMSEELIRVPLLIRVPGCGKTVLPNSPFSLLHLAPTLLDILGVPAPAEFRGNTYWPTLREGTLPPDEAVVETVGEATNPFSRANRVGSRVLAVRDKRYKLVVEFASGRETLFDLEADPREQNPLPLHAVPAVRRRLLERARHHLQSYTHTRQLELRVEAMIRELRLECNPAAIENSAAALASKIG